MVLVMVLLLAGASVAYKKFANASASNALVLAGNAQAEENKTDAPESKDSIPADSEKTADEPSSVSLAPDFTVYDQDGNEVTLSSFFGKPIVLNFWASWCPPCRMEMPDFNQAYLELGSKVHFLMVNMTAGRETKQSAQEFIQEENFSFPVYFDLSQNAAVTYGAYSLPTTYFIDASGAAVAYATGAIDADTLRGAIDMILR